MLENLPPKRICKKIFPSLSKTKKTKKNIKPKLLAKHKIYNNLRKTRAKQISQAAKILSKTKSHLNKPRRMTTRSSSMSVTDAKKKNKKRNIKLLMNKNFELKSSLNMKSNEKSLENRNKEEVVEVDRSNIKLENNHSEDLTKNQSDVSPEVNESESSVHLVKCTDPMRNLEKAKNLADCGISIGNLKTMYKTVANSCNTIEIENKSVQEKNSHQISNETTFKNLNTVVGSCMSVSHINNKNVKRSKRINDCIAMLTGKLEEKLKTEQKILAPHAPDNTAPSVNPENMKECDPAISSQTVLCQMTPVKKFAETLDDGKCILKKTPKRKTISRKIVKSDFSESKILPATSNTESNIFDHLKIGDSETIATSKNCQQPVTMNAVNQKVSMPMQSAVTTPTFSLQNGNKQTKSFITPTLPIISQQVITPNTSVLLPKLPLYMPMENLRLPISNSHVSTLPIAMPLPVPVPISIENVTQVSPGTISTSAVSSNIAMLPTPGIPIMSAVTAHLKVPPAIPLTASSSNSMTVALEPLNLSNSSKNAPKQSHDVTCSGNKRVCGIPARRQTICGFESRNFAVFDEMEPLDLSKKPRSEKMTAACNFSSHSRPIEMASLLLPPKSSLAKPNDPSVLTIATLTPEALVNKPFYSNLDLLRIPQVRNPVVGQVNSNVNDPSPQTIATNTITVLPQPPKTVNKKRNKPMNIQPSINCNVSCVKNNGDPPILSTSSNVSRTIYAKDLTNITHSKKEVAAKNKSTLRMDVEVINHIDDAINSVINAVKASLDNEEAQKAQEMKILDQNQNAKQDSVLLKTTDEINSAKESNSEFYYLTAGRRNIRSKTLDCRPAVLIASPKGSTLMPSNSAPSDVITITSNATAKVTTLQNCETNTNVKCSDTKMESIENRIPQQIYDVQRISGKEILNKLETKNESKVETKILETGVLKNLSKQSKTKSEFENIENALCINPIGDTTEKTSIENVQVPVITTIENVENLPERITTTDTTINTNLDLEQVSNHNNTSSGFHSSAQSDQHTSVMSTTTSAISIVALGNDTKKKQRRRRKNELAAIVADQLLESFKLDKARRDNLKKLENLAYEKSEDLLLTGMLLMSSTKRNVASSSNNSNTVVENNENIKRCGKIQRVNQNNDIEKQNEISLIETKPNVETASHEKSLENEKDALDVNESVDGKKNSKRRQYRRRGKTLDNENISKLKSSLESFSIDIERQLSEYEAKNVNVFKNVVTNELSTQSCNLNNQKAINITKPSIILRPSILSVTLESGCNQEISQTPAKSITIEGNKTVLSSRDPRLNKNIHKEGEKNNEITESNFEKGTSLDQKNNTGPDEIGDLDEDNYLTEIAKNVNEKIMSTENEEFAFKDDGFEMVNDVGMDDSNSKFSRPPTSMSVRSAPNLNDDRSNFGSICDENTNTEIMDMDLDDEMSVYTSYSQDLGRGRGRRRRRRRSILLTRKPKKRGPSRDMSADKIECILCKKVFYSANSLSKHNMTLAHVSKVSEQEYLLSKSHSIITNVPNASNTEEIKSFNSLGPYARRSTRRSTISEPPMQTYCDSVSPPSGLITKNVVIQTVTTDQFSCNQVPSKSTTCNVSEMQSSIQDDLKETEIVDTKSSKSVLKPTLEDQSRDGVYHENINVNPNYNGNSRLNLNPDERLFFECCNILKSAETPRINNTVTIAEECNLSTNYTYSYNNQEKSTLQNNNNHRPPLNNSTLESSAIRQSNISTNQLHLPIPQSTNCNMNVSSQQQTVEQQILFRDPPIINQSCCFNKPPLLDNR